MSINWPLQTESLVSRFRPGFLALLTGLALAGCGGGSDGGGSPNPPAPPPPPPPPGVPPLSANPINISANPQVGVDRWSAGNTSTGGQGQPVSGVECTATMPDNYHVHSHVAVFLNGQQLSVPNDVGIVGVGGPSPCFYTIHTHDKSGKIHVEASQQGTYTLGQLFAIWGQPLSSSDVAGLSGMTVKVYVTDNGVVTEANAADWANIELRSKRLITIVVGTAITEIPNYTWSGN